MMGPVSQSLAWLKGGFGTLHRKFRAEVNFSGLIANAAVNVRQMAKIGYFAVRLAASFGDVGQLL